MHRRWADLGGLGVLLLLAILGCRPTESRIKPPPLREEYTLPPADDARFSAPPVFPKEAGSSGPRKLADPSGGMPPSLRTPGSTRLGGPGMSGY